MGRKQECSQKTGHRSYPFQIINHSISLPDIFYEMELFFANCLQVHFSYL